MHPLAPLPPDAPVLQAGFWVMFAIAVGYQALSYFLMPKPKIEDARAAGKDDIGTPTTTEDRMVPVVWGSVQIESPNVLWYGDLQTDPIHQRVGEFLPGFGGHDVTVGHRYSLGVQYGLCLGPIDKVRRVWMDDKLVWTTDLLDGDTAEIREWTLYGREGEGGNGGVVGDMVLHAGALDQAADSYLSTFQTPVTPGYVGMAYAVWRGPSDGVIREDFVAYGTNYARKAGYIGNSPQIKAWKFEVMRCPNGLGVLGGKHVVNDGDANLACVLYEILTDPRWGLGLPSSAVDVPGFLDAADTFYTEGNGLSMAYNSDASLDSVVNEIERQGDCILDYDHDSEKFVLRLVRRDYTDPSTDLVDVTGSVVKIRDHKQMLWSDTTNMVQLSYTARDLFLGLGAGPGIYKDTVAVAQDDGNIQLQNRVKPVPLRFPGVKTSTLAANLASRELRARAIPLATAVLSCDRAASLVVPGQAVAWTDADLGYSSEPFRVSKVVEDPSGTVDLYLAKDVYYYAPPIFGVPPDSAGDEPGSDLQAIDTVAESVLEMPRAFAIRDTGVIDRLFFALSDPGDGSTAANLYQRHASGSPSGAYALEVQASFCRAGVLYADVAQDTTNPTTATTEDVLVVAGAIESALSPTATDESIGQDLANLVLVDDELMGVSSISASTQLRLVRVFRGLCDTAVRPHSAGAAVFVLQGTPGVTVVPRGHNVDVQARGVSMFEELPQGSASTISFAMADRCRRPYPPTDLAVEGTRYPASVSLDSATAAGSNDDQQGFDATWTRRDFRTFDEVVSATEDGETTDPTFPAANTTEYRLVASLTDGTELATTAWSSDAGGYLTRTEILAGNDGEIPDPIRVEVEARHTFEAEVLVGRFRDRVEAACSSAEIGGAANTGARAAAAPSAAFVAAETGSYSFDTVETLTLQASVNGGGYSAVISASNTGTLALTAGDSVVWKVTGAPAADTLLKITAPSATLEARGICLA